MKLYPQSHHTDSINDLEKIFFLRHNFASLIISLREWKIEMKHHARNFSNSFFIRKKFFQLNVQSDGKLVMNFFTHDLREIFQKFLIAIFSSSYSLPIDCKKFLPERKKRKI